MAERWDLVVYDRNDQLVLIGEVKNRLHASPEWAARLRRNIFAHGVFPNAPYFLMVFPDTLYLWTSTDPSDEAAMPSYTVDARPVLQPYFEQVAVPTDRIGSKSLEIIVASWLSELIHGELPPEELERSQAWLTESGLYAAVAKGRLEHEVLV